MESLTLVGNIFIWATDPHDDRYNCLINWKNMFNLQKFSSITSILFDYKTDKGKNLLYLGDEMGYIRVYDFNELIDKANLKPIPKTFKEFRKVSPKIEDVIRLFSFFNFKVNFSIVFSDIKNSKKIGDATSLYKELNVKQVDKLTSFD